MLRSMSVSLALALCACAATTNTSAPVAAAFDESLAQDMPPPEAPGEQHRWLQGCAGTYEGTLTAFLPGAPSEPVAATDVIESFGPFWTISRFECEFMGAPYMGTGCQGYDAARGCYVGNWTDTMGSYLAMMEGERRADGTLVMRWEAPGPDGGMAPHRSETVRKPSGGYTSTFYIGEGAGTKSMAIDMQPATPRG